MNDYIFYTIEGTTTAPNESIEVNNCQLLGFSKGFDKKRALKNLLSYNPWISEAGYNVAEIIGVKVVQDLGKD